MNLYNLSALYQFFYCFRLKSFKNVQLTYMLSHAHVVPPLYCLTIIAVVIYLTYYHRGGHLSIQQKGQSQYVATAIYQALTFHVSDLSFADPEQIFVVIDQTFLSHLSEFPRQRTSVRTQIICKFQPAERDFKISAVLLLRFLR